jgi:autotransporter adhesin
MGENAVANGGHAVAIGSGSAASMHGSTAVGMGSAAVGNYANAFGHWSSAIGNYSTAMGGNATASADGSVAIGDYANANGAGSVAIGSGSSNGGFANSVALGAGTTNTAANQVHVGGRTVSGVAAGALNATSTDAVNGSQLFATNQVVAGHTSQIATLSSQVAAINTNLAGLQSDIDTLFDLRREDRRDMKQGIAGAIAMADAPMPSQPGGISYAFNGATFRGEYAVGGSLNFRLNTATPMAVGVGFSYAGNKNNGARVGVSGEF